MFFLTSSVSRQFLLMLCFVWWVQGGVMLLSSYKAHIRIIIVTKVILSELHTEYLFPPLPAYWSFFLFFILSFFLIE